MAKYKPYTIMAPPFEVLSGGIRVLYGLYGWLLAKGQIVYLNAKYDNPDFVAIYPEILWGNEAGANTVVRYILNKPGVMSSHGNPGPTEFPPTDLIYGFTKLYDTFNLDDDHIMFLPILNTSLFKDQKRKRTKNCVFVGKGVDLDIPETKGLERISRAMALDQGGLADFLNKCEIMYTFENPTAMNELARLCGCRVVFVPKRAIIKYTKEEIEEKYEPGTNGISWGTEEEKKLDVGAFRQHYIGLIKTFEKKLDKFIFSTQKGGGK